ncbi:MAG: hypothetical protein IPN68_04525 [Bacteroidetes bacterium]|nr:hypothetical protein [Bacteroidota bacterium]
MKQGTDGFPPAKGTLSDYSVNMQKDGKSFSNLKSFSESSRLDINSIELGYDIFENLKAPDPSKPGAVYHAADFDFRLKTGSLAVDAGKKIPGVNDDFTGKAPDLGAVELGNVPLVYGTRGDLTTNHFTDNGTDYASLNPRSSGTDHIPIAIGTAPA